MSQRLAVSDLVVEFIHEKYAVRPLDGLSFDALPGEMTVLLGPSGSGKTTLLSCLGGILTPTSGMIKLGDNEITGLAAGEIETYRRRQVGFVFQAFNLIPSLTAQQNVAIPLMLTGTTRHEAMDCAKETLKRVGMSDRRHHLPSQLSGGQQQRVAVARGIVHSPPLLLADEPTANLDHVQAESIIRLLRDLREQGSVIVVSTHDARLVPVADKTVQMSQEADISEGPPQTVRYVRNETIFEQGDRPGLVYMIEEGEVDIIRVLAGGGEELIARIGPGQYFGELGSLMGYPRSASARAATDVALTAFGPRSFRETVLLK